jgi:hypothetical protein
MANKKKKNAEKLPAKKVSVEKKPEYLKATIAENNMVQVECENLQMKKTTGFYSKKSAGAIIKAAMTGLNPTNEEFEHKINQYLEMMAELKPQDGFEGLLITQMVTVFNQTMEEFRMANIEGNRESTAIHNAIINRGVKLMRLYNQQLEALDKHRRKGNQKMTVEHVHVYNGGQAIVGEVHQGGANNEK